MWLTFIRNLCGIKIASGDDSNVFLTKDCDPVATILREKQTQMAEQQDQFLSALGEATEEIRLEIQDMGDTICQAITDLGGGKTNAVDASSYLLTVNHSGMDRRELILVSEEVMSEIADSAGLDEVVELLQLYSDKALEKIREFPTRVIAPVIGGKDDVLTNMLQESSAYDQEEQRADQATEISQQITFENRATQRRSEALADLCLDPFFKHVSSVARTIDSAFHSAIKSLTRAFAIQVRSCTVDPGKAAAKTILTQGVNESESEEFEVIEQSEAESG